MLWICCLGILAFLTFTIAITATDSVLKGLAIACVAHYMKYELLTVILALNCAVIQLKHPKTTTVY